MDKIINLKQARKAKLRAEKEKKAAENRVIYGRTKEEKQLKKREEERAAQVLDGHKRESDEE